MHAVTDICENKISILQAVTLGNVVGKLVSAWEHAAWEKCPVSLGTVGLFSRSRRRGLLFDLELITFRKISSTLTLEIRASLKVTEFSSSQS
jgi:hypothetical protein